MRNLHLLDIYRLKTRSVLQFFGSYGDETCGMFLVPSCIDKADLKVMASVGMGWDHVSVSRTNRCPNWPEMDQIHHLFFKDDELAFQLHMPADDNISFHPNCLHIWRPHDEKIPTPPSWMVGPQKEGS